MSKITEAIQNNLLQIIYYYYPLVFSYHGVHYIDAGYKYERGHRLSSLAIRIHVHHKRPLRHLSKSEILPQYLENIPVDIIQSNPGFHRINFERRNLRYDPLIGGIAIRNPRFETMGTLGKIVLDVETKQPLGLTNHHVLIGDSGQSGDTVIQPATGNDHDIIGNVLRWNQAYDCAVFSINPSRHWTPDILELKLQVTGKEEPLIGMEVTKSGLATGVTAGIIDGVSIDEFTIVPLTSKASAEHLELSGPGDSGSIWLETTTGTTVGLHYAGETDPDPAAERAWAKKITGVCSSINIII